MAVTVVFDQERRRVCVEVTGELTGADVLGVIRTARADAEHQMWPMFVDARSARSGLSEQDIANMVEAVRDAARRQGIRGHVALIADDDTLFAQLMRYEIETARIGVRVIRVFRKVEDAELWLKAMADAWKLGMSAFPP